MKTVILRADGEFAIWRCDGPLHSETMSNSILLLAALFCLLFTSSTIVSQKIWTLCPGDRSKDLLQIIDIKTAPALPTAGASFQVTLLGRVMGQIKDGNVHTVVYYAPAGYDYPLYEGDADLCSAFGGALGCPISPGQFHKSVKTEIPPIAPRGGPYNGTLALSTASGDPITCVRFKFEMQ